MSKISQHRTVLEDILVNNLDMAGYERLRQYLLTNSNLPGPRGNLELAHVFGNIIGDYADVHEKAYWQLCQDYLSIPVEEAPVNTPDEFLPFCGAIGIGAMGTVLPNRGRGALTLLKKAASDPRWRLREGVAMGLQSMLSASPTSCLEKIQEWVTGGDLLEMRAAVAGVAEPLLLHDSAFNIAALDLHRQIIAQFPQIKQRKSDPFRVLRKGLGYTLSVVVSAQPEEGFAYMESLTASKDSDILWILRENLKKKRLSNHYPERVEQVKQKLHRHGR